MKNVLVKESNSNKIEISYLYLDVTYQNVEHHDSNSFFETFLKDKNINDVEKCHIGTLFHIKIIKTRGKTD